METKTIAVDFGRSDIYSKIEEGLAGLEIGVLGKKSLVLRREAAAGSGTEALEQPVELWRGRGVGGAPERFDLQLKSPKSQKKVNV